MAAAATLASCSAGSATGAGHRAPSSPRASSTSAARAKPAAAVVAPAATSATNPPAAKPAAAPSACAHNATGKLVLVDVSQQHLWLCQGATSTFDSPVTSGAVALPYDSTPTGSFEIQQKDRNRTLTLLGGKQFTVKYWIPFQGPLFGFHDSPWQTMPYGSQDYRTEGSHGCVHLPLATIKHLYHWAEVGTAVRIRR